MILGWAPKPDIPKPVYAPNDWRGTVRPEPLPHLQKLRAQRAASEARRVYPGAAGEILARECQAYAELDWLTAPSAPIAQLINELLGSPPTI